LEPLGSQQVLRLVGRGERPTYGCGSAPDFDRLPLAAGPVQSITRWVTGPPYRHGPTPRG